VAARRKPQEAALIDRVLDSLVDMVVVDTDVMSYVFKHDTRADLYEPHLAGKDLIISFVTYAELQRWAIASNWGDSKRNTLAEYVRTVLVFHSDDELCVQLAKITDDGKQRGRQIQAGDAWIAATALLHDVSLITHNRRDFDDVTGLKVISESSR
jgi:tRNA(fMet)-specific endonuclease VapC